MNEINKTNDSFESIKHIDEFGNEFWYARELMKVLEYKEWRKFESVINKAKQSCETSGISVLDHFVGTAKMVQIGSGAERKQIDYELTRYACYLIAQNGDSRKKVIALAQTYFAVQTRKQEISEKEYSLLTEDEKRFYQRDLTRKGNYSLNQVAKNAGVKNFDKFHNSGYKGLYNGETADDIAKRKGLRYREDILDNMCSEELIANLFRISQTEAKLKRDKTDTEGKACKTHYDVGKRVRQTIEDLGGTMPEELPIPESKNVPIDYNEAGSVRIYFNLHINKKFTGITIDGTPVNIPINYNDADSVLDHQEGQVLAFSTEVTKKDSYVIELKVEEYTNMPIGNFLWNNNPDEEYKLEPNGQRVLNDDYVAHSKIEIVKVEYTRNGQKVTKAKDELYGKGGIDEHGNPFNELDSGDNAINIGTTTFTKGGKQYYESSMTAIEGTKLTLKITPDYGYQVTSFGINGQDLIVGDAISEFTIVIHGGNQHIGAKVTATKDDVKSTASIIDASKSEITLGAGTIDAGTARATITEAELTDAKKAAFEEQVAKLGDDYEVATVVDIKLNQVFFKGNDGSDVWTGDALEDLNTAASLELGLDGVNMDGAVLVHNVHDGEEFETINAGSEDGTKNTSTYPVKSFSNYAVVVKKSAQAASTEVTDKDTETAKNVSTGDYITGAFAVFAVAGVGLFFTKRAKTSKLGKRYRK